MRKSALECGGVPSLWFPRKPLDTSRSPKWMSRLIGIWFCGVRGGQSSTSILPPLAGRVREDTCGTRAVGQSLRIQSRWRARLPCVLLPDQGPADWECSAIDADNVDIIVHIPDCCLSSDRIVKKVIRESVTVKVGRSHQGPATGNVRPKSASDERWSR